MMESNIDYHAHANGLRETNTSFKVLFAIITLIICISSPSPLIPLFVFFLIPFLLVFMARIPYKVYLKFIAVPVSFALFTLLYMSLFFGTGAIWYNLGFLGPLNLSIYYDGFQLGFLVMSRMLGAFSCLVFLAFTTPMTELFALLHYIRIPSIVVELSMLIYRFIFVFLDEALKMHHSQKTRLGYQNLNNSFRCLGMLGGNLFIRTWIQGEKLHRAMESRGYNGTLNSMDEIKIPSTINLLILFLFELSLVVGIYATLI